MAIDSVLRDVLRTVGQWVVPLSIGFASGLGVNHLLGIDRLISQVTPITVPLGLPANTLGPQSDAASDAAQTILKSDRISFATDAVRQNVEDAAKGKSTPAGNGTEVRLSAMMLRALLELRNTYRFQITSIAGGTHAPTSYHYQGQAVDIGSIEGQRVDASNPHVRGFMNRCRALGAVEVLGPGDPAHDDHVHCAWGR